jgi:hypothetical protein
VDIKERRQLLGILREAGHVFRKARRVTAVFTEQNLVVDKLQGAIRLGLHLRMGRQQCFHADTIAAGPPLGLLVGEQLDQVHQKGLFCIHIHTNASATRAEQNIKKISAELAN